ncbi:MAG TPA: ribose-5-phosphate isomerase A, partial [Gemmatimonadales bacterium]|nr:ribose-5-phosphate isomerase A [Gemmatimonadales bacterium]
GGLFVTEAGNLILDCAFGPLAEPGRLAALLAARAGIVEHGLFLGMATDLLVAGPGGIEHRTRR